MEKSALTTDFFFFFNSFLEYIPYGYWGIPTAYFNFRRFPILVILCSDRMDATLKEIGSLILEVNPDTRRRGTVFEFRLVYPELTKSIPRMKELGSIVIGQKGFDDNKTLAQLGYV